MFLLVSKYSRKVCFPTIFPSSFALKMTSSAPPATSDSIVTNSSAYSGLNPNPANIFLPSSSEILP